MTDGVADAGAASAILKHVGGFTSSVVGDIVTITAGTNCTAGWYWITTVTSADQVTLDRNYTSGDTTNVTCVVYHNFPMIGADGVCLKCFDGAPTDSNTEIDRDGWIDLDVGNNDLYYRSQSAWYPVVPQMQLDTGAGLVTVLDTIAGADTYVLVGRDDTGVATNAVTDVLVIQAGAGATNEAAGQGVGVVFKLGNDASEVEERGSIDFYLQGATNGAEYAEIKINQMVNGSMVNYYDFNHQGFLLKLSEDLGSTPDLIGLFGYEISAGNRTLGIATETAVVAEVDETKFSHKLPLRINGSTYYMMLTAT
jgi:hypothetical protein